MNKMKKEIREILFPRWDNLHGEKKLLVLCILVLAVWVFYVAEREMKKKKQSERYLTRDTSNML